MWLSLVLSCADPDVDDPTPGEGGGLHDSAGEDSHPPAQDSEGPGDSGGDSGGPERGLLSLSGDPPDDLILISIDTTRRDFIGFYGGPPRPFLDDILSRSVTLDDHRSCSDWTYPSMICVLSGAHPGQLGIAPEVDSEPVALPEGVETLAIWLSQAGFAAGMVNTNPFLTDEFGLTRGYSVTRQRDNAAAEEVVDNGLEMLESLRAEGGRWFLHLHFLDPHSPYSPPEEYLDELRALPEIPEDVTANKGLFQVADRYPDATPEEQALIRAHLSAAYSGEIDYLDDQLARLFSELQARGALDDALVALITDHGEQLFDHGEVTHPRDLYSEETAALAALYLPGRLEPARWSGPTTHIDFAPTLLTLLGVESSAPLSGIAAGEAPGDRPRFAERVWANDTLQSVDVAHHRLIYAWSGEVERYDLSQDPGELSDLYAHQDWFLRHLWFTLAPRVAALHALYPTYTPAVPHL